MPIDHEKTAEDLERTYIAFSNLAAINGSLAAFREADHAKETLLGLADYHRAQAAVTDHDLLDRIAVYLKEMIDSLKEAGNPASSWKPEQALLAQIQLEKTAQLEPHFPSPKATPEQKANLDALDQAAARVLQPA